MGIAIKCGIWLALWGVMALGFWLAGRHWDRVGWKSMVGWCLIRLMALAVLVFVFDRSLDYDIEGWLMHGEWMVAGYRPGIDFRSPYAYGFNLVLKWTTMLGGTQFPLAAFFAVVDFLAMGLLYCSVKEIWDEKYAKRCLILYFTSPVYLTVSCLWIQDEPICLGGMALLIWCATWKNKWLAGLGMAFAAGLAYFFSKTLIVFYLAPFLLLRGWRMAILPICAIGGYLLLVKLGGFSPFELVFGRTLGMGPDVGEYVLDQVFAGNVWSVLSRRLPPVATGTICFLALSVSGSLFLPDMLRKTGNLRERMQVSLELVWIWFFVFNIFYSMNIITYVLPMVPFLILVLMECRAKRTLFWGGTCVLISWYMLRVLDVYILSTWRHTSWGGVLCLVVRLLLLLLASMGLWIGVMMSCDRFAWLTRRLFPEESR